MSLDALLFPFGSSGGVPGIRWFLVRKEAIRLGVGRDRAGCVACEQFNSLGVLAGEGRLLDKRVKGVVQVGITGRCQERDPGVWMPKCSH